MNQPQEPTDKKQRNSNKKQNKKEEELKEKPKEKDSGKKEISFKEPKTEKNPKKELDCPKIIKEAPLNKISILSNLVKYEKISSKKLKNDVKIENLNLVYKLFCFRIIFITV